MTSFLSYTLIFLSWVLLVNASNESSGLFIKMLFYYVDVKAHSYGRILIHLLIQYALIPIMLVIKSGQALSEDDSEQTFEQRQKILRIISNLSLFIWLITSIVALQY